MKRSILALAAGILAVNCVRAWGGVVLFSDLGTGSSVYETSSNSWGILGSANSFSTNVPQGIASLFTAGGSGSEAVGQIDLGMWYFA